MALTFCPLLKSVAMETGRPVFKRTESLRTRVPCACFLHERLQPGILICVLPSVPELYSAQEQGSREMTGDQLSP